VSDPVATGEVDPRVDLAGIPLRNPVLTASGTFGYGTELSPFLDLTRIEQEIRSLDATAWAFDPFEHGRGSFGVSPHQQSSRHRGGQIVELRRVRELIPEGPQ